MKETAETSRHIDISVRNIFQKWASRRRNKDREFIFVHIPKTGGGSLGSSIREKPEHLTASMIKSCLGKELYDSLFKFSIVRNTWDRLLSVYLHFSQQIGVKSAPDFANVSFEDFIKSNTRMRWTISQLYWLTDNDFGLERWTPAMYSPNDSYGELIVDKLLRFEDLNREANLLVQEHQDILQVSPGTKMQKKKLNKSKHGHYSTYYTNEMRSIVEDAYRDEIERFGFIFEENTRNFR